MTQPFQGPTDTVTGAVVDPADVRAGRGWFIGLGILFMLLGGLAIFTPLAASLATTVFLGWLLIAGGLFQGVHAFQNRRWAGSGWAIFSAVLQVIAGVAVIAYPVTGTLTLTLVLATLLVANGVVKIVRAYQHRSMSAWGWLVLDGGLSVVLGLMIGLGWPSSAAWALGMLVGIDFIMGGSSMLMLGILSRPTARARA
jgi:uncharacterized membrane protein HdeD (DUF308 family)